MLMTLLLMLMTTGCVAGRHAMVTAEHGSAKIIARAETVVAPADAVVMRAESEHLGELGAAARDKKSDSEKPPKEHHRSGSHCSRCNSSPCSCDKSSGPIANAIGSLMVPGLYFVMTSPFTIPAAALGDDYEMLATFPDYPYAGDLPGALIKTTRHEGTARGWMGTLQIFDIQETDNIDRFGGRLVLDSSSRFGIDTESNYWIEPGSAGTGSLWTGDANVCFRFAESENVQFRAGVGVNWLADGTGAEAGINFTYGMDWFPRKPWTVSTVFDAGTIGGGSLFHNRTTAGVMLGPVEAFAGYDYFRLGSARFHGPVAGLGWRF
jgi:hypothetical protein